MTGVPEGVTDAEAMMGVVLGVRRLSGHQVVSFEDAWEYCTGCPSNEIGPEQAERLTWLLKELGYRLLWVAECHRYRREPQQRWVREKWPTDSARQDRRTLKAYGLAR